MHICFFNRFKWKSSDRLVDVLIFLQISNSALFPESIFNAQLKPSILFSRMKTMKGEMLTLSHSLTAEYCYTYYSI